MLVKLKGILERGLQKTAAAWPELSQAYQWIYQAAQILENEAELPQSQVEKSFQDLMESMSAQKQKVGSLAEGIEHFLKITRSYWPGLFHCYSVDGLPRTNNDLEHVFGSYSSSSTTMYRSEEISRLSSGAWFLPFNFRDCH